MSHYLNPLRIVTNLLIQRDLIAQFTRRDIEGRYRGSFLGLFWSLVTPLVMLSIYTFVFGVIFRARWHGTKIDNLGQFALVLFCGLVPFNFFSECVSRAPSLIVGFPSYVKKVVFPLEILPISMLGTALFHAIVSLCVLLIGNSFAIGVIQWTTIFLPLVALPIIFLTLGISWFLAGLGVYVRDINNSVSLAVQILFFLTPIFYSYEAIPEPYRTLVGLNPLTSMLENFRRILIWGKMPNWNPLILWTIASAFVMVLGYTWFMKAKRGFADVI